MELFKDPKTLLYAILGGAAPAVFWLWFWLKEEGPDDKEPRGLIALAFVMGALMVMIAVWVEKYSLNFIKDRSTQIIVWAAIEEVLKFGAIGVILYKSAIIDEPMDYPMYFIATALGFAALENVLYLMQPIQADGTVVGILTGNLRFLGSTLLHLICSSMIGSALGLAFYLKKFKGRYLLFGIAAAITLHSAFNFFIMKGSGENFLSVFGFLWVVAIINILIFEKLKRMKTEALAS
ncbi:MAG: PrsW family glutamic-type intramembrane protease [Patescibacteria group bacterium]